jgi:hypothetical protein
VDEYYFPLLKKKQFEKKEKKKSCELTKNIQDFLIT